MCAQHIACAQNTRIIVSFGVCLTPAALQTKQTRRYIIPASFGDLNPQPRRLADRSALMHITECVSPLQEMRRL